MLYDEANVRPARSGFSIIELLMVIFIIAVLLTILLPSLQSGRESARRIGCINNMRQISLALQNYAAQLDVLPPGVVNSKGPVVERHEDLQIGWIVQILPYMEQNGVWQAFDSDLSIYAPENMTTRHAHISSLLCPVEKDRVPSKSFGLSSYAACHHDVEAPIDADDHGVFFLNSSIRPAQIRDGSSYTIFVGEKLPDDADQGWASGARATLRNTGSPIQSPDSLHLRRVFPVPKAPKDELTVGGFGSRHAGGANFAFGDGSVRFLRKEIKPSLFRLLGNRDDGEMLENDDF